MVVLYEKMQLLKGLLAGETASVGPFYATVDVTRGCNLQCSGCPFRSPMTEDELPPGNQKTLDLLHNSNGSSIQQGYSCNFELTTPMLRLSDTSGGRYDR